MKEPAETRSKIPTQYIKALESPDSQIRSAKYPITAVNGQDNVKAYNKFINFVKIPSDVWSGPISLGLHDEEKYQNLKLLELYALKLQ